MTTSALLVGVNKYQNGNNLRGCCNDVDNVHEILTQILGYRTGNVRVLKDSDATTDNIIQGLATVVGRLHKGDIGFFHFSGHGSQVADNDGDEADRKDELICPHDMSWVNGRYITDDTLGEILHEVPEGAWMEVLLDSCHSGTATRMTRELQQQSMVKTIVSPHVGLELPVRRMREAILCDTGKGNHVLWSGCADDQLSSDAFIGTDWNGAFTYHWCECFREDPNILRHKLLKRLREKLRTNGFDQVPQLEVVG